MTEILKNDLENIAVILEEIKLNSIGYLNNIGEQPTSRTDQEVDFAKLSSYGLGTSKTLELFKQKFSKLMVSSSGPRYWGYVVGGLHRQLWQVTG